MHKRTFQSIYKRLNIFFVILIISVTVAISLIFRKAVREFVFEVNEKRSHFTLIAIKNEILLSERLGASISQLLEEIAAQSPDEHIFMIIQHGKIINEAGKIMDHDKIITSAASLLSRLDNHGVSVKVQGVGPQIQLVGVAKLDDTRFLVMISKSKFIQENIVYIFFLYTSLLALIIFFAITIFSQKLSKPIIAKLKKIESAIKRYKLGDNTVRIDTAKDKQDEFDLVFHEFNEMADTIENLKKQLLTKLEWEKTLLSSLAHDMNTPITILRGNAENLMEHGERMRSKDVKKICITLLMQSLYLQSLVDDLLTLANAKISRLSIKCETIPLDPFFDSLVDVFNSLALDKGIVITGDGAGIQIWADPVRLRQIMSNLVRNAITYADKTSYIEIWAETYGNGVLIHIRDDGNGLPLEIIPVLFSDKTDIKRDNIKGWGLGLRIVKMLTELHGGWCKYIADRKGAYFQIWFPMKQD